MLALEAAEIPAGLCYEKVPVENPAKRKEVRRLKIRLMLTIRFRTWRFTLTIS